MYIWAYINATCWNFEFMLQQLDSRDQQFRISFNAKKKLKLSRLWKVILHNREMITQIVMAPATAAHFTRDMQIFRNNNRFLHRSLLFHSNVKWVEINQFMNHKIEINQIDANLFRDKMKVGAVGAFFFSAFKSNNKSQERTKFHFVSRALSNSSLYFSLCQEIF